MQRQIEGLILQCATGVSPDAKSAILDIKETEPLPSDIMKKIRENIDYSNESRLPLCQDTGSPIFFVDYPPGQDLTEIEKSIVGAVKKATVEIPLRPNSVDPITGKNTKDNCGGGFPQIHFNQWDKNNVRIRLLMKGGGSENLTRLYKLPDNELEAFKKYA